MTDNTNPLVYEINRYGKRVDNIRVA